MLRGNVRFVAGVTHARMWDAIPDMRRGGFTVVK